MLGAAPIGRRYSTCKLHISSVQDELEDTEINLKNTQVLAVYIQHTLSLGEAFRSVAPTVSVEFDIVYCFWS